MKRLARIAILAGAAVAMAGSAFAQYRDHDREDRVRPRWNQAGSAVCPDGYDYYRGWCRARSYEPPPQGNAQGSAPSYERLPPRWNAQGSAVCPQSYDYDQGWCRPKSYERVQARWNSQGSAVCPQSYDYDQGWCRPKSYERVQARWNAYGSAVCPELYDYYEGWCRPRGHDPRGDQYRQSAVPQYGYGGAELVPPQWNTPGSAVCPESYDYYQGQCRPREDGLSGRDDGRPLGEDQAEAAGVPPQWNRRGSAVCPENYDYIAQNRLCMPRG